MMSSYASSSAPRWHAPSSASLHPGYTQSYGSCSSVVGTSQQTLTADYEATGSEHLYVQKAPDCDYGKNATGG